MAEFLPNLGFLKELGADPFFNAQMDALGNAGLAALRARIPVDTGDLLASAEVVRLPGGGQRLQVGTGHWSFVEYGTSLMAPEPFLRPTLDIMGLGH